MLGSVSHNDLSMPVGLLPSQDICGTIQNPQTDCNYSDGSNEKILQPVHFSNPNPMPTLNLHSSTDSNAQPQSSLDEDNFSSSGTSSATSLEHPESVTLRPPPLYLNSFLSYPPPSLADTNTQNMSDHSSLEPPVPFFHPTQDDKLYPAQSQRKSSKESVSIWNNHDHFTN